MKNYIYILFTLLSISAFAQVGFGTNSPDPSSSLDLTATDKGMLFPEYALVNLEDSSSPVMNPADGLIIYNNSAIHEPKGYYTWIDNAWRKMFVSSDVNQFMSLQSPAAIVVGPPIVRNYINELGETNNPIGLLQEIANESQGTLGTDKETITLPAGKYKLTIACDLYQDPTTINSPDLANYSYLSLNTYVKALNGTILSPPSTNSNVVRYFSAFNWTHYFELTQTTSFKVFCDASADSNPEIRIAPRTSLDINIYELKEGVSQ